MILAVSETVAARLVTLDEAITLMEETFAALDRGESRLFPAAMGEGGAAGTRFGAKLGYDGVRRSPGVKVGSYWPGNKAKDLGNHASTTLLLDDETGLPRALIAATQLTALRTAASDAMAVKHLANPEAGVLAVLGAGHQALWNALAIARVRSLEKILVWSRRAAAAETLADRLRGAGYAAASCDLQTALGAADIVSTATAARAPLFAASDIRPGIHISAMGADGQGKQELDPALLALGALWADLPSQSMVIGEFQHLPKGSSNPILPIGGLVSGRLDGRGSASDITIYDSSGVALQDLAICSFALERAQAQGLAFEIDLS